jgi:hypothetical protein
MIIAEKVAGLSPMVLEYFIRLVIDDVMRFYSLPGLVGF